MAALAGRTASVATRMISSLERTELQFVAEPLREAFDHPGGVIERAVEPAIDGCLDAPADRLEERERSERRGSDGKGLALR